MISAGIVSNTISKTFLYFVICLEPLWMIFFSLSTVLQAETEAYFGGQKGR